MALPSCRIGPKRSDLDQPNSQLSTPWQSSTLTERALDLDQSSGWMMQFRLGKDVMRAPSKASCLPSPLVGEGGSLTRSGSETDEGSVSAEATPHPPSRAAKAPSPTSGEGN